MPIIYKLAVGPEAKHDLKEIWQTDPDGAGVLDATLRQIATSQRLLESLTIKDFGSYGTETFHVAAWVEQQRKGRNLWRFKHWDLEARSTRYRVIYALDPRASRYYVLGIFTRDFDYEPQDPRTRRVVAAYDRLGIPPYR